MSGKSLESARVERRENRYMGKQRMPMPHPDADPTQPPPEGTFPNVMKIDRPVIVDDTPQGAHAYGMKLGLSDKKSKAYLDPEGKRAAAEAAGTDLKMISVGARERGYDAFLEKSWDAAVNHYTRGLSYDKEDCELLANRCLCYLKLGDLQLALRDGKKLIRLKPKWSRAMYRYAQVLQELEKFPESAAAYERSGILATTETERAAARYGARFVKMMERWHQQGWGAAYAWGGETEHGQLGQGYEDEFNPCPREIRAIGARIRYVTCGESFAAASSVDGDLWVWGAVGRTVRHVDPHKVIDASEGKLFCAGIDAGYRHLFVVSIPVNKPLQVLAMGDNGEAQLGIGDMSPQGHTLIELKWLRGRPVVQMAGGGEHSAALFADGSVFSWGSNMFAQLGLGHRKDVVTTPTKTLFSSPDVEEACILQIALGNRHTLAIDDRGRLWCYGNNNLGQCGQSSDHRVVVEQPELYPWFNQSGIRLVSCHSRAHHCAALSTESSLYMWGKGDDGELGQHAAYKINMKGVDRGMAMPDIPIKTHYPMKLHGFGKFHKERIGHVSTGFAHTLVCIGLLPGEEPSVNTLSMGRGDPANMLSGNSSAAPQRVQLSMNIHAFMTAAGRHFSVMLLTNRATDFQMPYVDRFIFSQLSSEITGADGEAADGQSREKGLTNEEVIALVQHEMKGGAGHEATAISTAEKVKRNKKKTKKKKDDYAKNKHTLAAYYDKWLAYEEGMTEEEFNRVGVTRDTPLSEPRRRRPGMY